MLMSLWNEAACCADLALQRLREKVRLLAGWSMGTDPAQALGAPRATGRTHGAAEPPVLGPLAGAGDSGAGWLGARARVGLPGRPAKALNQTKEH